MAVQKNDFVEDADEKDVLLWSERIAEEVVKRGKEEYVIEGMWTPSGFFHIGNARTEVFTPYSVRRAILDRGFKARQNFIIDDFDAVRKIPDGLGVKKEDEVNFLGFPCATAPSPIPGFKHWADFFVAQLKEFAPKFGVDLNFISAYETYKEGKFNDVIKFSIEHSADIVAVWQSIAGSEKKENFVPLQVLCEKCKKIYYTAVLGFDGAKVKYKCSSCGFESAVSPFDGNAKLHWRVHWVAHWLAHNVDFESGGKDHFSKGGSVDVGRALIEQVFKKQPPVQVPTEFLQLSGEKMSGSKGNVIDLEQWFNVASPELFRFLNFSYKPSSVIEFSFRNNSFVLLNDRFERAERIFYGVEQAENPKMERKLKKAFEFSQIGKIPGRLAQVPFHVIVPFCQLFDFEKELDFCVEKISEVCSIPKDLSSEEKSRLLTQLRRAKTWVEKWAPEEFKTKFLESLDANVLASFPKEALQVAGEVAKSLGSCKTPESIQQLVYDTSKTLGVQPKVVFQLFYTVLIGRQQGPKVGTLIIALGKERVAKRLAEL